MASEEQKRAALAAFESGGTALGLGYLHGRKGTMPEKWKIPLDGAVAAGGVLLGVFGGKYIGGDKVARHVTAVGVGALSYFFGSLGGQFGQKARFKAGEMKGPAGPYLTGDEKKFDPSLVYTDKDGKAKQWRDSRTITAGWQAPRAQAAWQQHMQPTAPYGYGR